MHLRIENENDQRSERPTDPPHDAIGSVAQFGIDQRKAFRLRGEAARIGSSADLRHPGGSVPGGHGRSGEQTIPHGFADRVRLPGQQRFIDFEARVAHNNRVGSNLVAHAEHKQIVDDNPIGGDLTDPAVSHDSCRGRTEKSERIEKAFGAEFLQHSDQHVRQGRESEQAVLPIAEEQENESAGPHNRIEQGEQVGPKDV